jgi:putative membrane protein
MNKLLLVGAGVTLALSYAPLAHAEKAPTLSHADSSFVSDAAQGGMDEVKMGEMAAQNGASDRVRSFGKKMVDEHTKLNNDLQFLAGRKGLTLPADIGIAQKAGNKLLSTKTGRSFDESYVSSMVKDHREDVEAFQKEANYGSDEDVKAFAFKALPTLREHLRMAQELAHELGISDK